MVSKAFVFPGQGSQSIGMLSELAAAYPEILNAFEEASDVVGYDVWQLTQEGPEDKLNQTEHTQVAVLTADVAVFNLLKRMGLTECRAMAGHSLGEYAALVCADALELKDAVRLVSQRGRLMQDSIPLGHGAMAAIVGLSDEQVRAICTEATLDNEAVIPANYNAIGQVVIAGHTPAVDRAIALATNAEARLAKVIPVSVPCHCPLLEDAAERFALTLNETPFKTPVVDVISNVDLEIYTSVEQIKERLKEQLYSPVRWVETIQLMKDRGVELIIETGPGKVLSGLVKRIDKSIQSLSVSDIKSLEQVQNLLDSASER